MTLKTNAMLPNDVQEIFKWKKDTASSVLMVYPFHCNGKSFLALKF